MAVNGIQFPPGMSLVEFFQQRGTEVQREGRCRRPIGRRAFGARVVAVLHTACYGPRVAKPFSGTTAATRRPSSLAPSSWAPSFR